MSPKTVTLNTWEEIHDYGTEKFAGWMFRGQQKAKWELKPSFQRCCERQQIDPSERARVEDRVCREFRRIYHQYATHVPAKDAVIEWMALMQHHGAPTRLLDFTYSMYVAAYFATEECFATEPSENDDCAIWAFDGPWMKARAAEKLRAGGKKVEAVNRLFCRFQEEDEPIVSDLLFSAPFVSAVWPINPFRLNERLRIQQGVFLVPGNVSRTFAENLDNMPDANDRFLKIVIPVELAMKARQRLFSMAISRTSLFPGLDGYAQSLRVYSPALKPPFEWTQST